MKKAITKEYQTSNTILDGDFTECRIKEQVILLRAQDKIRSVPCWQQCALFNPTTKRCNGFCYRWTNYMTIVFKLTDEPKKDYTVVETPYAKACREMQLPPQQEGEAKKTIEPVDFLDEE